ncbi:unnamed protein product [Rotaria sordida]|uniref:RBR-type E3 ubiquitin transferase n=1 Tax=Rotaria sordida TaxID=392033 RepID=A0A819S547_9BILA|nr:unnamed protein product [Rotaria sordida]CAF1409274.1 unnamed protein product [Rotaria sordida]CAF1462880.1 unnamed protein product [Rotaria sordida]CAF3728024.1 unnamed protein product [Rotaria sordida]CAF3871942.1 unnamed protein product [Rotaria sordida]
MKQYDEACYHVQRDVCDTGVNRYVEMSLRNSIAHPIKCPEPNCRVLLKSDMIFEILNDNNNIELLEVYDSYLDEKRLERIKKFIRCAHGCGSGEIHSVSNPKVVCIKYRKMTCFIHKIPWHDGITCEDYERLARIVDQKSYEYIKNYRKQCPKWRVNIEKNFGCDHMNYTKCQTDFCWECLSIFRTYDTLTSCQHKITCSHFKLRRIRLNHSSLCTIL